MTAEHLGLFKRRDRLQVKLDLEMATQSKLAYWQNDHSRENTFFCMESFCEMLRQFIQEQEAYFSLVELGKELKSD